MVQTQFYVVDPPLLVSCRHRRVNTQLLIHLMTAGRAVVVCYRQVPLLPASPPIPLGRRWTIDHGFNWLLTPPTYFGRVACHRRKSSVNTRSATNTTRGIATDDIVHEARAGVLVKLFWQPKRRFEDIIIQLWSATIKAINA